MTALQDFARAWGSAIDVLANAHGESVYALCQLGLDSVMAKKLHRLADTYFGPATATRKQRHARDNARANHHTVGTLEAIERFARRAGKQHAWAIREALTALPAVLRTITARGTELLDDLTTPPANPEPRVTVKRVSGTTFADLSVRGPAHLANAALRRAEKFAADNEVSSAEALLRLAGSEDATGAGPEITPAVIIPIDSTVDSWHRDGDTVRLSLTDATTMTAQDFVSAKLAQVGHALLVDPWSGEALDLFTFREDPGDRPRFASFKQRMIQRLLTPVCARPGCGCGADDCQMHHIVAYKHGGATTLDNLTMLCDFDNGRNDDDRASPRYGHIEKINGLDYWVPAFGGPPQLNMHPAAQGGAIRLARKMSAL